MKQNYCQIEQINQLLITLNVVFVSCFLGCSGLTESIGLSVWSTAGGTVREGLADMSLLEKLCHLGVGFEISKAYIVSN